MRQEEGHTPERSRSCASIQIGRASTLAQRLRKEPGIKSGPAADEMSRERNRRSRFEVLRLVGQVYSSQCGCKKRYAQRVRRSVKFVCSKWGVGGGIHV